MSGRGAAVCGLALAAAVGVPGAARACSVDGVPSLSANGALVRLNTVRPSRETLAHWAQFVVAARLPAGAAVRFSEDLASLRRALPAQAFDRPWRWRFGDGGTATGAATAHSYARPGDYKLVIEAYYGQYKSWFEFDAVLIHVGPAR